MDIKVDDLSGSQVVELEREHIQSMVLQSPPESMHALGLESLRKPCRSAKVPGTYTERQYLIAH